jgi:Helix-turn-helix domain
VSAGRLSQCQRVLDLLRQGPQTTVDLHAAYVLAVSCVIHRLRAAGHVIDTTVLPSGMALYTLKAAT